MRAATVSKSLGRLVEPYRGLGPSLWSMFGATMINRFGDFVGFFLALFLTRVHGYEAARAGAVVSTAFAASAAARSSTGTVQNTYPSSAPRVHPPCRRPSVLW